MMGGTANSPETATAPQHLVDQIDAALLAHDAWRQKLTTSIRDSVQLMPAAQIARDDCCTFGIWLYGPEVDEATRAGRPWQVVRRLHAEFHQAAGKVATLSEQGRKGEAYHLLDNDFAARSTLLARALAKWRAEATS